MLLRRSMVLLIASTLAALLDARVQAQDALHPEPPAFFAEAAQAPRGRVFKERVEPRWFKTEDSLGPADRFWYRNDLADGRREFIVVDPEKGERAPAFDHAKLAAALAKETKADVAADRLPFDRIVFQASATAFQVGEQVWAYDSKTDILTKASSPLPSDPVQPPDNAAQRRKIRDRAAPRGDRSPDGKWTAFVRDHNLYLRKTDGTRDFKLTEEGTEADRYEGGVFWSPDSSRFIALRTAKEQEHTVSFVQSSPLSGVQPKLLKHQYLKPGDRIAITKPHLFSAQEKEEILINDQLFANPWSLGNFVWADDSARFLFSYNQRGHQVMRVIAVDARTGEAKALVDEQSKTFFDYSNKTYCHIFAKTDEILWMSERDGWNHLYLIDAKTGAVKNQVTKGEWLVRGVDHVDEEARTVEFRAVGIHPGEDPYHVHLARVKLDGTGLTTLTDGDGTHTAQFSPGRKYLIDSYSRVDLPPVHELRRVEDGKLIVALEKADASALESSGWTPPERFKAKGRDGKTEIYGLITRPAKFDRAKKYPVIEQIYAGPHGAHVPKAFSPDRGLQGMADLGYILVQIDGMGTNWRSKAFHDVCWKNLKDAGFPDRIAWMKAAAETRPEMDLSRVGVYGGSAGGQNAMGALLFHGDFYKAAVADCGCHDNRMDKIWWNEAWMGWPVDKAYEESSNVVNAHQLKGKLMLMVGETDHNVDPASTMQVVHALVKADKDFELIVFPGADHGAGGSPYGRKRMRAFFARHLLGGE